MDDASDTRRRLNLGALKYPEGSLLLIDAQAPRYVTQLPDIELFLATETPIAKEVEIATITGVGSSALGSAALAWKFSRALGRPVLAIVPG